MESSLLVEKDVEDKIRQLKHKDLLEKAKINETSLSHEKRNITQSNALIRAAHHLTLQEKRIVYMAISQINPILTNNHNCFIVKALDYSKLFNVNVKSSYRALKAASDKLFERHWQFMEKDGKLLKKRRWVSGADYHEGKGYIKLYFTDDVMFHLQGLFKEFTSYKLKTIINFKSKYSIKLYELLISVSFSNGKNNETKGWLDISFLELKHSMEIPKSYSTGNVKKVIESSIKEVSSILKLDIKVNYKKDGRSIKKVIFIF